MKINVVKINVKRIINNKDMPAVQEEKVKYMLKSTAIWAVQ